MNDESKTTGVVHGLLRELDFPISSVREDHKEMQTLFEEASEPIAQLLVGGRKAPGHVGFVLNQLAVRALSDVIVSFHLAMHGFLNSAYNEIRIAYEACDLIRLVAQDHSQATLWIESDKPWTEFSPAKVREKLGVERVDEVYSHLCGMAHPRFEGADLTGYAYTDEAGETGSHFSLGPSPLTDERPFVAHAMLFIGQTLGRVAASIGRLVGIAGIDEGECLRAFRVHTPALQTFLDAAIKLAAKTGQTDAVEFMASLSQDADIPVDGSSPSTEE